MAPEAGLKDEARLKWVVAPRFALRQGLEGRLECNGGTQAKGAGVFPKGDWRPLEAAELASVEGKAPDRDGVPSAMDLALLEIPEQLRGEWWAEAERGGEQPAASSFQGVLGKVVEFLRFKRLPLPDRVHLSVAVNAPGLPSTRVETPGVSPGLGVAVPGGDAAPSQALACINLGDEATSVVVLELPLPALAGGLGVPPDGAGTRLLVSRYFEAFPGQRLLKVRLAPCEGLWLSPLGVVHDGWTVGKQDLDVMLHLGVDASAG